MLFLVCSDVQVFFQFHFVRTEEYTIHNNVKDSRCEDSKLKGKHNEPQIGAILQSCLSSGRNYMWYRIRRSPAAKETSHRHARRATAKDKTASRKRSARRIFQTREPSRRVSCTLSSRHSRNRVTRYCETRQWRNFRAAQTLTLSEELCCRRRVASLRKSSSFKALASSLAAGMP